MSSGDAGATPLPENGRRSKHPENKRLNPPLGTDPYRYCCPRGHHALKVRTTTKYRYVCRSCQNADCDAYYTADDLIDKKEAAQADDGTWNGV